MGKRTARIVIVVLIASLSLITAQAVTLSTNAAWTWIKGTNITNQTGTYGTQGAAAPANMPGARYASATWADANGALWLFGGSGYDGSGSLGRLNDLWKYDPGTTNWTWTKGANSINQNGTYGTPGVPAPANTPGARSYAVSWADGTGALWLFGGRGYGASGGLGRLNDLWKYDPGTTNWTWMKGANITNQNGIYGTQGVPTPTNTPGGRYGAVSWADADGALWLFGGLGFPAAGGFGYLNDLWKFDPGTTNWTWMKGTNVINQNGTYGTPGVPAPTNTPGGRGYAVLWMDVTGALWLFGGEGYDASGGLGYLNDLWKFDSGTTNWTWIKSTNVIDQNGTYGTPGVPAPTNTPGGRGYAVSWADGTGALWLFGGVGYAAAGAVGYLNDLWKFNPGTTNWTWMKGATNINQNGTYGTQGVESPTNTPGGRESAVSWADANGALWLFGGWGYPASGGLGYLNDLWKFNVFGGILLDTNALVFSATFQGANPVAQMIGMTNVGVAAFTYTNVITYGAGASGWLTVLPAAGAVALNGATTLTNQVNIAGLNAGAYYATNHITADATNSPQTVVVTLTVNAPIAPGGLQFDSATYSVNESNSNVTLMVTRINGSSGAASVQYAAVAGTASAGSDYTPQSGTLSWPDGDSASRTISVAIVNDSDSEGDETFMVSLSDAVGASLGSPSTATVTIQDGELTSPTGVSASDGTYTNKVLVTWNASSGATSYEVWRYTSDSSNSASKISSPDPTGTNYDDTSATAGITYYYWVKAVNDAGARSFSAPDSGFLGVVGPLITANGLVGDVYLDSGDLVTIAVQMMNIEPYLGAEVDWWVVAFAHSGEWYYMDNAPQWQEALFSGDYTVFHPVYQGPLDNLSSTPVLSGFPLPDGTYEFWFAVDYPLDGILNLDGPILYDNVTIFVQ